MGKTLFFSFSGLARRMNTASEPTQEQLDTGLFFMACSRDHALDPRNQYVSAEGGRRIREAILKAELEGRCEWRRDDRVRTFGQLYRLIQAGGYTVSKRKLITPPDADCNAFAVEYFIKRVGLDMALIA